MCPECGSGWWACPGKTAANICAEILPLKVAGTTAYAEGNFQGSATAAPPPTQRRAAFADVAHVRRAEALREGFKKADEVILATPDPGLAAAAAERGAASLDLNAVSESQSPGETQIHFSPPFLV